jgi:hypothetical protein
MGSSQGLLWPFEGPQPPVSCLPCASAIADWVWQDAGAQEAWENMGIYEHFFRKKVRFDTPCSRSGAAVWGPHWAHRKELRSVGGGGSDGRKSLVRQSVRLPHARETATTQHRNRQVRTRPDKAAVLTQNVQLRVYHASMAQARFA